MSRRILIACTVLFFILQNQAKACSCTKGAHLVKNELKRSVIAIKGKVLSIENVEFSIGENEVYSAQKVTLSLLVSFKGEQKSKKVVVYTGMGRGDCGFPFVMHKKYILYGVKSASPFFRKGERPPKDLEGAYWTDICTRTQSYNRAEFMALRKVLL